MASDGKRAPPARPNLASFFILSHPIIILSPELQCCFVSFTGTNTDDTLQFCNEDLPVTNSAGISSFANHINNLIQLVICNRNINFYF